MFFKSYVSLLGKVSGDYTNKSCKVLKDKNDKYFPSLKIPADCNNYTTYLFFIFIYLTNVYTSESGLL